MATHPDGAELRAYLANELSEDGASRVLDHLAAGCPECEAVIDGIEREADPAGVPSGLVRRVRSIGRGVGAEGPPPLVPRFEIVRKIGSGGMAVVYLARDAAGRDVALKLIPNAAFADPETDARFIREGELFKELSDRARALPRPQRPALAEVYEIGRTERVLYISMEYAAGGTFRDRRSDFAGEPVQAARLLAETAEAVAWLNEQRPAVLHRDCKPSNFLLQPTGGADGHPGSAPLTSLSVRVSDLGLARRADDAPMTRSGDTVGSIPYLAPELLRAGGVASPATEVYALGITLYELLDGDTPFRGGSTPDRIAAIRRGFPARPGRRGPPVPAVLQAICLKCLEWKPDRRYATVRELAEDLRRFTRGEAVSATLPTLPRRVAQWPVRNPVIATVLIGLVLAVCALAGLLSSTSARADASERQAALEAEQRSRAEDRLAGLGEKYALLFQLGVAQGDSQEVLTLFERAKAEGLPLTPAMRLAYIRGLAGVHDTAAVRREVDAVPLDGLPPAVRGQFEIWRATTRFGTDDAAAEEYLRAALSRPLPPAEREYAAGLRAVTTPAAVEHFRTAVRHDRLYQPARSDAGLLLLALGRLDEAIELAEESARTLPKHPDFPVILACAHALRLEEGQARAAVNRLEGLLPEHEIRMLRKLIPLAAAGIKHFRAQVGYTDGTTVGWLEGFTLSRQAAELFDIPADRVVGRGVAIGELIGHLAPAQRARLTTGLDIMRLFANPIGRPNGAGELGSRESLKLTVECHPERLVMMTAAKAFFDHASDTNLTLQDRAKSLKDAAQFAERAAHSPGSPATQDIAFDMAVGLYAVLSLESRFGPWADRPAAGRAAVLLRQRLAVCGMVPVSQFFTMVRVAINAGDLTLARELLDNWEKRSPNDPLTAGQRADVEFRAGSFSAAIRAAERVLKRDRFDLAMHLLRLSAWVKLLELTRTAS